MVAAINARQDHLRYLAGAAARMGDFSSNPNVPAYLSPAAVGHLSRWFNLPWCVDSRAVLAADVEAGGFTEKVLMIEDAQKEQHDSSTSNGAAAVVAAGGW